MPEFYLIPKDLAHKAPRLVKLVHRLEAFIFRTIFWIIRRLSIESALKLAGTLFYVLGRSSDKLKKAHTNLEIAFPDKSPEWRRKTAREIFRSLGYASVELIKLDQIWDERDSRVEFVVEPGAREHMRSRAATVFVTAHVGAWQVAPLITREYDFIINAIYAPESNPVMNALMLELRKSFSDRLIAADAGPRPILKELNRGHSIVLAMDTRPDTGKLIPFFGTEALTNTSAVGLALRSKAALVMGRAERLPGGRFRVTVYDPITSPNPEADLKDQAAAITEIMHGHFEQWIREAPEQWICLKRRWPKENRL